MDDFQTRAASLPESIGSELQSFGGYLRCHRCHRHAELGNVSSRLRHGWPRCCGQTMEWITQSQIDAGYTGYDSEVASR